MDYLSFLTQCQRFFLRVRKCWKWAIFLIVLDIVCIGVLGYPDIKYSFLYAPVIIVFVLVTAFLVIWAFSYLADPIIGSLRKSALKKASGVSKAGGESKKAKIKTKSSNMLTVMQKLRAFMNLRELERTSDYSFDNNKKTYLRVQVFDRRNAFNNGTQGVTQEAMYDLDDGFPGLNLVNEQTGEKCKLIVSKVEKHAHISVVACIAPLNATQAENERAEKVELIKDEPLIVAYGWDSELNPDGTTTTELDFHLAITWIGGN